MGKVRQSQGSIVSLPKAELDLLGYVELARDILLEVLRCQSDRTVLEDVFGGDCSRVAKIQAVCGGVELSSMNRLDQRLPTCLSACQSVEKILTELGYGDGLEAAHAGVAAVVGDAAALAAWRPEADCVAAASPSPQPLASQPALSVSGGGELRRRPGDAAAAERSERILALVQADAVRREARFAERLVDCEGRLAETVEECREDLRAFHESLQTRLAQTEERLSRSEGFVAELLAKSEGYTNALKEGLPRVHLELEDRLNVLAARLDSKDELQRVSLQQQRSVLDERMGRLDARVASAEATWTELDACVQRLRGDLADLPARHDAHERVQTELLQRVQELQTQMMQVKELPSELESLARKVTLAELHKFRNRMDMDPLWQSFAHVGSLVRDLQKRLDELSPPENSFLRCRGRAQSETLFHSRSKAPTW
eukprot:TRINITY_DN3328_c2_g1_i2.p1 TRINITY_DN3328_c2_g1~~TRINITY_DN3328_c2_g1_i2.p1  ORF type:complete len:469 (-),score=136.43 TRINITY_DN3328_c2_g1_i2:167-1453(-)